MIDWNESAKLHNIEVDKLKAYFKKFPKSTKKILAICNNCGKIRYLKYYSYHDLCYSCSMLNGYKNNRFTKKIVLICDNCGKKIEKHPNKINKHNFCNRQCYGQWFSKNICGNKHNAYIEKITLICDNCGAEIKRIPGNIKTHNFCDRQCDLEWREKNIKEISIRVSAGIQHIPYDEWENYASKRLYCSDFNEECKESNRDKYDRMCFLTGLPEEENITSTGKQRKLSVHHVDMDKGQGCNGIKWKLVPICLEWHGKVHNELWEARIIWLLDNVW